MTLQALSIAFRLGLKRPELRAQRPWCAGRKKRRVREGASDSAALLIHIVIDKPRPRAYYRPESLELFLSFDVIIDSTSGNSHNFSIDGV